MVSLAENIEAKANRCVQARWLKFEAGLTCNVEVQATSRPRSKRQKEIREIDHVSLLAPRCSYASGVSSFLLAAHTIDRRIACTEL